MINIVSKHRHHVIKYVTPSEYKQYFGLFTSPSTRWDVSGYDLWACDNDAFTGFDANQFRRALDAYADNVDTCRFIVCPDVICDAQATTRQFYAWYFEIKRYGYPIAYVLQNGVTLDMIPWAWVDCLFIGGDDKFKFSQVIRDIANEAKARHIWLHMGRVSSQYRIIYSKSIGCDSYDGTHYIFEPANLKKHLPFLKTKQHRMEL
jgi:hypothetical protein